MSEIYDYPHGFRWQQRPGAVVLLHSTSKTNAEILDDLLTKWEQEGYTFGTLNELCG